MKVDDIKEVIGKFDREKEEENHRYFSYDFCYNYFYKKRNFEDLEKDCLALGFYLASWGMFRGSSFLLQKNARHFQKTINCIKKQNEDIWDIDVDSYSDENIKKILKLYHDILVSIMPKSGKTHRQLVLVTKVMLGVFGIMPAYDTYVQKGLKELSKIYNKDKYKREDTVAITSLDGDKDIIKNGTLDDTFRKNLKNSLLCIKEFYEANKNDIDKLQKKLYTKNFLMIKKEKHRYTKAKIIDMYLFEKYRGK